MSNVYVKATTKKRSLYFSFPSKKKKDCPPVGPWRVSTHTDIT